MTAAQQSAQDTEALIRDMLAKGRSLQVIVATSAWSLFEVRQIATADGYEFTKEGAPFKTPTKPTRGRHPAEAAAHPIDDERSAPPAFVPSPAPDPLDVGAPMDDVHVEPEHPATTTTAAPYPVRLDTDEMVRQGMAADRAMIRRAAERVVDALATLEALLTAHQNATRAKAERDAAAAAARARVVALEQELAEARAALHPPRITVDTPNPGHRTAAQLAERNRLTAIRVWGRANGFDVPNVGRVRAEVVQAYREAHPDEGAPHA